jgi:hypothetical protein
MGIQELYEKWKSFVNDMNAKGVPVPTVRDPKTGFGSISLTLVFVSSLIVIVGIIGKSAGVLGGLDMNTAMEFFWTATSLYFGRQFQTKSGSIFGQLAGQPPAAQPAQSAAPKKSEPPADDPDAQ